VGVGQTGEAVERQAKAVGKTSCYLASIAQQEDGKLLTNHTQSNSNWLTLYRAALLEIDKEKLLERVDIARKAIRERIRELAKDSNGSIEEKRSIDDALMNLRSVLGHNAA
jgi:hypothetical protein